MTKSANLMERYERDLPSWLPQIKQTAFERIAASRLMTSCADGNKDAVKAMLIRYWPFVDVFPSIIAQGVKAAFQREKMERLGASSRDVVRIGRKVLREVEKDETDHRELWLASAKALDVLEILCGPRSSVLPEVREIIRLVSDYKNPSLMFLYYATIEIIAESVSRVLLASDEFRGMFRHDPAGLRWFGVHTEHHEGRSHEEVAYRLAFTFNPLLTRTTVGLTVLGLVDLFIFAGDTTVDEVKFLAR